MSSGFSVDFFDAQFRRQVAAGELALNPFESLAVAHLVGDVLDLGCGLGNLSLEAARRGHAVTAVDGSPAGIARIRDAARLEGLSIRAIEADLASYAIERGYDTVVAIGLLMFFSRRRALELLAELQRAVRPGGRAIVNVLVEGTTFTDMFDPRSHYLFAPGELERSFAGWTILHSSRGEFDAPRATRKLFATIVAERPSQPG